MRLFFILTAFGLGWPPAFSQQPASRPNIILILADDLGWADLSCYGNRFNETPALDSLARRGLRFTRAYAACPVCSPSRTAILTGQTPARAGVTDWLPGRKSVTGSVPSDKVLSAETAQFLDPALPTLPRTLRERGYATVQVGKWHLGEHTDRTRYAPTAYGFDVALKARTASGANDPNGGPEYHTDRLTDEALGWMENHLRQPGGTQPFFLYLAHDAVHIPIRTKPGLLRKYQAKQAAMAGDSAFKNPHYAALLESLDQNVGRVMALLRRTGLDRNTIVIFTSDNGGLHVEEGPLTPATSNAPLRGGKGYTYEGGVRVPFLAYLPGVATTPGVSDEIVWGADFFPTLCALAGVPVPDGAVVDGRNVADALRGGKAPERPLFWHYPHYSNQKSTPSGAVRMGDWKLVESYETGRRELFNLRRDPGETHDLAAQHPRETSKLARLLDEYRRRVGAKMPLPKPASQP